jgi:hypothetical protein
MIVENVKLSQCQKKMENFQSKLHFLHFNKLVIILGVKNPNFTLFGDIYMLTLYKWSSPHAM